MKFTKAEQAAFVEDLRAIAKRLADAPAYTEELAKADLERRHAERPDVVRYANHYPHQVGGLEQICTSSAQDILAVIRRLGDAS